jgi:hypothetical protein
MQENRGKGAKLEFSCTVPSGFDRTEIRVYSDRNTVISKDSDVKECDPNKNTKLFGRAYDGAYSTDMLFPVVDIDFTDDMEGVLLFENAIGGIIRVNPMYHPDEQIAIEEKTIIPASYLEWWENWVYCNEPNCRLQGFYLRKTMNPGKVNECFSILSNGWNGRIDLIGIDSEGESLIVSQTYGVPSVDLFEENNQNDLSSENLVRALNNSLQYLLDCQDLNPKSPMYRALNLFYDYEAKTYRHKTWLWTHAPAMQAFVRALDVEECQKKFGKERLLRFARDLGDLGIDYQELDKSKPYYGMMLCRYDFSLFNLKGYESKYSPVDSLFFAGIGMMPLYHATGEKKYLDFCTTMVDATTEMLQKDPLIQQDYYPVTGGWKTNMVNEAGFGMEGIADTYLETKDPAYLETGKICIEQLVYHLENDEGLWDKNYFRHSKRVDPNDYLTRGMAWGFMGISSAYRMGLGDKYLKKCRVMADYMAKSQRPDGAWSFYFNTKDDSRGISEKGTAAWCYLFYRMYGMTGEQKYLDTARTSLNWLINNQYLEADVQGRGGIPAETPQSGVVFRSFFKLSCSYTVSFFALGLLEELKLRE